MGFCAGLIQQDMDRAWQPRAGETIDVPWVGLVIGLRVALAPSPRSAPLARRRNPARGASSGARPAPSPPAASGGATRGPPHPRLRAREPAASPVTLLSYVVRRLVSGAGVPVPRDGRPLGV